MELDNNDTIIRFVGVTARTKEDALHLVQEGIFNMSQTPNVKNMKEIVSINELDQNHVLPNMGEFVSRGIWFPVGYANRK